MKAGFEQKNKVILMVVMLVGAVAAVWYAMGASATPSQVTTPPPASASMASVETAPPEADVPPTPAAEAPAAKASTQVPDPTLHLDVLAQLRAIHYGDAGTGRDLFHFSETPEARAAALPAGRGPQKPPSPPVPVQSMAPPPPPPIPLKFYGYAVDGGTTQVFLQLADSVYIVTEGQIVDHRYLIEHIGKLEVMVKDTQTNQEQQLPLLQG